MQTRRVCRKCLLREAFPEDYEKYVASLVSRMASEEKADGELYKKRMDACRECEKLVNGTCMACGCMVEIRGMQKDGKCPCKKW